MPDYFGGLPPRKPAGVNTPFGYFDSEDAYRQYQAGERDRQTALEHAQWANTSQTFYPRQPNGEPDPREPLPASMRALGGSSGGGSGMDPMFLSKLEELWHKPPVRPPAPPHVSLADESEAERAALTQSKERAGLRLRSSMRGLDQLMSQRGITGSGIHASGLEGLFEANQGEQAQTDRDLIQSRTGRARQIADENAQFDAGYNAQVFQGELGAREQLVNLLRFYGMQY